MNIKQVFPCVLESGETGCVMHGQVFEVTGIEDLEGQNMNSWIQKNAIGPIFVAWGEQSNGSQSEAMRLMRYGS